MAVASLLKPVKARPTWVKDPSKKALALADKIAQEAKVGVAGFIRPVDQTWAISSSFGPRWGRNHNGVDLAAPTGEPVLAADAGEWLWLSCGGNLCSCMPALHYSMYYICAHVVENGSSVSLMSSIFKIILRFFSTSHSIVFYTFNSGHHEE